MKAGTTSFVVFDGLPLHAKANEDEIGRRWENFDDYYDCLSSLYIPSPSRFCFYLTRERENRLRKADDCNTSPQEANKLRSQAVSITFDDVTVCIHVSMWFPHIGTLLVVRIKGRTLNHKVLDGHIYLIMIKYKQPPMLTESNCDQILRFVYPTLSPSTDLFSRKSEVCCFALRVRRADSFPTFQRLCRFSQLQRIQTCWPMVARRFASFKHIFCLFLISITSLDWKRL